MSSFRRIATLVSSKHFKFGAPLLIFCTGVPFFLKDLFQVRYDYRGHSTANIDEATKYGHLRQEQVEEKRKEEGGEPVEYRLKTLEEEHEIYMEKQYSDTYEMKRGPRPWEIEPGTDLRPPGHKVIPMPKKDSLGRYVKPDGTPIE